MGQSYFIWNGIDCRSMGITMRGPAAIIRPEERVRHVTLPGVSGDLTETEGENIYNSYIQTVSISVKGGFRLGDVYDWLRGAGYVTFSGEPEKRQQGRIIGAVTLNKLSRNLDSWAGDVQIYCQPLKEKLYEAKVTVSASGDTVLNGGDVECRPIWKVTPSGTAATVAANGKSITVTGLTSGVVIWIDSACMEVLNADKTAALTVNSAGDFPTLAVGDNTVTGSGWSEIEIEKRERFL